MRSIQHSLLGGSKDSIYNFVAQVQRSQPIFARFVAHGKKKLAHINGLNQAGIELAVNSNFSGALLQIVHEIGMRDFLKLVHQICFRCEIGGVGANRHVDKSNGERNPVLRFFGCCDTGRSAKFNRASFPSFAGQKFQARFLSGLTRSMISWRDASSILSKILARRGWTETLGSISPAEEFADLRRKTMLPCPVATADSIWRWLVPKIPPTLQCRASLVVYDARRTMKYGHESRKKHQDALRKKQEAASKSRRLSWPSLCRLR